MLARWARRALGSGGDRRAARISHGALSALASRGVGVLVTLVTVPLTIGYLGAERYGVWVTLSTVLTWLQLADLGLVQGLTNVLADANARGDRPRAQRFVATAFWTLAVVAAIMVIAFAVGRRHVQWGALLGAPAAGDEVSAAVGIAVILFAVAFPLGLAERVYISCQEGAIGNGWSIGASVATLGAVVVVTQTRAGLPALVAAVAGARLAVQAVSTAWLFAVHRRDLAPGLAHVDWRALRLLFRDGGQLLAVQLAALLIFGTDNYIIARTLGAAAVTPYSVAWNLFGLAQLPALLTFQYVWAALGDALARGELAWATAAFRKHLLRSVSLAAALAAPLAVIGRWIIAWWAGPLAVPPGPVMAWLAVWSVVLAYMSALSCLLNATGHFRGQTVYGLATAVLNVVLSIAWARRFGLSGVIAATVVSYAIVALAPATVETGWVLRKLRVRAR